jgi:putative iron-dependent peroxidase
MGILEPLPPLARYLSFRLLPGAERDAVLGGLRTLEVDEGLVVGLGRSLLSFLGHSIPGLRPFPQFEGPGIEIPSTPTALWCWLRGNDRGALLHAGRVVQRDLGSAFALDDVVDAFKYGAGFDLTGYEDGTENPTGEEARRTAFVTGMGDGLDGSSFVAVQKWWHDLAAFEAMPSEEQDATIGRRRKDNEELGDAPSSAHVRRTAQESFEPEAFILRRSMPWADARGQGLVFVAFGSTLDAFEALLHRMVGREDGITDALFRFTRPSSGAYFWCPPLLEGRLDLRNLRGSV